MKVIIVGGVAGWGICLIGAAGGHGADAESCAQQEG